MSWFVPLGVCVPQVGNHWSCGYSPIMFLKVCCHITLLSTQILPHSFRIFQQNPVYILSPYVLHSSPILCLITLIALGKQYESWDSSLCSLLQSPVTSPCYTAPPVCILYINWIIKLCHPKRTTNLASIVWHKLCDSVLHRERIEVGVGRLPLFTVTVVRTVRHHTWYCIHREWYIYLPCTVRIVTVPGAHSYQLPVIDGATWSGRCRPTCYIGSSLHLRTKLHGVPWLTL
jgi:hypothetical protein